MLQCAADASEDATSIDAFEKIKRMDHTETCKNAKKVAGTEEPIEIVINSTIMIADATKSGSEGPASSSAICESSNNRTCYHSSFTSSRTCGASAFCHNLP
ncbi:hypothetical protein POTOM_043459 [Populus tomentosa]|uniref:Uncharacterized protein n=1 Tax=Populus tomentosa TaxID=118781 RepID=A0A8X7YME7_POPTO|nr:hypothetical protein POTOM_043459 [Populus tomentosa]